MYLSPSLGRKDFQSPTESWAHAPAAYRGLLRAVWHHRVAEDTGSGARWQESSRGSATHSLASHPPCVLGFPPQNGIVTVPASEGCHWGKTVIPRQVFKDHDGHKAEARTIIAAIFHIIIIPSLDPDQPPSFPGGPFPSVQPRQPLCLEF